MSNLVADVHDLKSRLEWGQPAFTIIDVRDRHTYNHGHISGAISIPLDDLADRAKSTLHKERHIYVYGEHDAHTAHAAQTLRAAGFIDVSEIQGGLTAWKTVGGATEGV
ncbi:rhodanese-like domain-containing protein [Sphaerospermopsis aphanizomenoides BCCUSP55]|uniref:rhodanese-like domain-containing protein n=1 Tax=Sphaerospermopsis aphanizomenoides TaxID=459663 RepID=UPI001905B729|nr:rhodanese-like domain-containing protein [Sphaerospermopsis aphanizomenoides]MBK1990005.1 rhodanese-like domain-containing protein [Sphaerospermopsis aphanizomenoides BCCUSP55]